MRQVTSQEFSRNLGALQDDAQLEPIEIVKHGRKRAVLIGSDLFEALVARARQSYTASKVPDDILMAVIEAKMDPKHAHLDKLLSTKSAKVS